MLHYYLALYKYDNSKNINSQGDRFYNTDAQFHDAEQEDGRYL